MNSVKCKTKTLVSRELMSHQKDYLKYAGPHNHTACFMEMRLGKTLVTIRWYMKLAEKETQARPLPVLIVAPVSVLESWEKELDLELQPYAIIHGMKFDDRINIVVNHSFNTNGLNFILVNYESLRVTPGLADLPWFGVALDESTIIKSHVSQIGKLCAENFADVEHRTILSGMPKPESELDLFQQFKFLDKWFMGVDNYFIYRNKYFELTWEGWKVRKNFATELKDFVHKRSFILTRTQANIGSKKIREVRLLDLDKPQRVIYDRIEKEFVAESNGMLVETDHAIVQRNWLARITGGCDIDGRYIWTNKATELRTLLKTELVDQPVVVWFRFDSEIKFIEDYLRKHNIYARTLTGADSREQRKEKQKWFRTSPVKSRVILVQIKKVAEYGVDMSVSSTAIYYSVTYSCMEMAQTEDRILHPSKKEPLLYIYLAHRDTIDEDAVEMVRKKITSSKMFMSQMKKKFMDRIARKQANTKPLGRARKVKT